jgi:hypothetical protein
VSELRRRGVPLREIAVLYLYRVNFRSPLYEEALFEARVPFQVREEAPAPRPPHRHWINGVQVGPDICDNLGDPGIQQAFNEFHNNLHIATKYSIGPAAPGLHNGQGGEIVPTPCSVTTPPQ